MPNYTSSILSVLIAPSAATPKITPILLLDPDAMEAHLASLNSIERAQLASQQFTVKPGSQAMLLNADGQLESMLCVFAGSPLYALAKLSASLAPGDYQLVQSDSDLTALALGFALGSYQFTRYKPKAQITTARLVITDPKTLARAQALTHAVASARDWVNTPTEDLGPEHLSQLAQKIAQKYSGSFSEVVGDSLLDARFPAIHAVGRASHRDPRLIELSFGSAEDPLVVLVGKGVCFDTGGLDMKASDGMALMKKDMGGAAVALALTELILQTGLKIRLKLLLPAVENAIGPNAYRPGEVIATRAGISVEIGNTDAEGRVVLGDSLVYACESAPELLMDFATLTGAARIALGPDLPALFCNNEKLAADYLRAGEQTTDRLWRMPLWRPYLSYLKSNIADLANAGPSKMAGCISAALYLERFVREGTVWSHVDVYSWNDGERPGRPAGGEAQGLRAVFQMLKTRYPKS